MIRLLEINEENWMALRGLRVSPEQEGFLDSAVGILARGYVYRNCRPRVLGIADGKTFVGLALVKDLDEAPACYDLQQFLIDHRFQGMGYGTAALVLLLAELKRERKYDCVEVCVKQRNAAALRLFGNCGFVDTGYVDEAAPDFVNLVYRF
ncbi:MAG: GNAT family N-acetyltransferase [Oscillospiraceae bacterium]|nr:GNAT family N-acetyltransferase [Oscillospiraceae bacterium]